MSVQNAMPSLDVLQRSCPVCDNPPSRTRGIGIESPPWRIAACEGCGFVYLPETPAQERFVSEFAWEKSWEKTRDERARAQPILTALDRATRFRLTVAKRKAKDVLARVALPGDVIELGCGDGGQLAPPPRGLVPFGIDISAELAALAAERFADYGGTCLAADAISGLEQFEASRFTGALLHAYLEHEIEPVAVLKALRRVLKPGAPIVVKVPNHASWNRRVMGPRWCGYRLPDHVNYFTPASLESIAARAGLDAAFPPGWTLPTNDNMWALLRARA
jgi:SAM-dependent methyltransferase